jgi:hypothetical protein
MFVAQLLAQGDEPRAERAIARRLGFGNGREIGGHGHKQSPIQFGLGLSKPHPSLLHRTR